MSTTDLFYVSLYEECQRYGGPEEGGWWRTDTNYVMTLGTFPTRDMAESFRSRVEEQRGEENLQRADAVNRGLANMPEDGPSYPDGEGYIPRGQLGSDTIKVLIETTPRLHEHHDAGHYE